MTSVLYSDTGVPLTKQPDCPRCGDDELGSHFDSAWCCACGWRGSLAAVRKLVAELRRDGGAMP